MKPVSSLVNRQVKFLFTTKNGLLHNFCKGIAHIVFPNFTVSAEYLESPPHKKSEFFLTLVNGWSHCSRELDFTCCGGPRCAPGLRGLRLWLNAWEKVSVTLKEINQKIRSLSSLRFSKKHIAPHRIVR